MPLGAFVSERRLGEDRVLLQVGQQGLDQLLCHRQQIAVGLLDDAEAGYQPPLGRAATPQAGLVVSEIVEVAGHLPLEKLGRVDPADGQDAFVGQAAEIRRVGHCGSSSVSSEAAHHRRAWGECQAHCAAGRFGLILRRLSQESP